MIHFTTQRFVGLLQPKALATIHTQWPDPEQSIGLWYRSLGKYSCWEAKGPARESFIQLAEEIKRHLGKHGDSLTHTVIWSVYMIGRKKDSAAPTVMFCCKCADSRRKVRRCIEESGILKKYPGFNVGDCSQPPDFNQLVQLGLEGDLDGHWNVERVEGLVNDVDVLCAPCENGKEMSIFVKRRQEAASAWSRKATASGTFRLGDDYFYLTVAHVFTTEYDWQNSGWDDSNGSDDFEFDIGGMEDDISSNDDDASDMKTVLFDIATKPDQLAAELVSLHEPLQADTPQSDIMEILKNGISGELILTSASGPHPSLDYALINIPLPPITTFHSSFLQATFPSAKSRAVKKLQDGNIVCFTGSSGRLTGEISGTPSFVNLPGLNGKITQEVWTVRLNGTLTKGDCGSWIFEACTGNVWGQIVAGSPDSGTAYIIPAYQIFEDLEKRLGGELEICRIVLKGQQVDLRTPTNPSKEEISHQIMPIIGGTIPVADNTAVEPGWEKDITDRFRKQLSTKRMSILRTQLSRYRSKLRVSRDALDTQASQDQRPPSLIVIRNIPIMPTPPNDSASLLFRNTLSLLSEAPMRWENPGLLDEALGVVPLQQIYEEAEEECHQLQALAESVGKVAAWIWQDCVARALLKWFKRSFFCWVNNPLCSRCEGPSLASGFCVPTPDERALGATRVELYKCTRCDRMEHFARYNDAFVLLQTRRGRLGEWVNCFGMLARAIGCRVRWVWSSEDHIWLEIYSEHRKRWVHVDPCEEAWDKPLLYTAGWNKKIRYCLAFSVDGVTDVTRRYLRNPVRYGLDRNKVSESVLLHILDEICHTRRRAYSKEDKLRIEYENMREQRELRHYYVSSIVSELFRLSTSPRTLTGEKHEVAERAGQTETMGSNLFAR